MVLLGVVMVAASLVTGLIPGSAGARSTGSGCATTPGQIFECTTTTLSISPSSPTSSDRITLTATVTDTVSGGYGAPQGPITFYNGTNQIGSSVDLSSTGGSSSQASITTTLAAGSYTILASYDGDTATINWDSSSASQSLTVSNGVVTHATATSLQVSPGSGSPTTPVSLTATVSTTDGSGLTPTSGTVTFRDGGDAGTLLGTVSLNGSGQATLSNLTFGAGTHTIVASYGGSSDGTFSSSSNSSSPASFSSVAPPSQLSTTTQITSITPNPAYGNQTVVITAHVSRSGSSGTSPTGTVTFRSSYAQQSTLLGTASVQSNGDAVLTYTGGFSAGAISVTASYAGDTNFTTSTSPSYALTVTAPLHGTSLTYSGPTDVNAGVTITLSARLVDTSTGSAVQNGESVTLSFGSHESCTGTTSGGNGVASCQVTVSDAAGVYPVTMSFAGDTGAGLTGVTTTFQNITVHSLRTSLTYTGSTQGTYNSAATLSAKLLDSAGNAVAGKTIAFTLGSQSCTGTTSSSGSASCTLTLLQDPSTQTVSASFAGDGTNSAASTSATFTILQGTTSLAYTGATRGGLGQTVTLAAVLTAGGSGVAGKSVSFTVGGNPGCTATTDATGTASCSYTAGLTSGSYPIVAAFAGDTDLTGSSASATLLVSDRTTTLVYTGAAQARYHDTATLAATLTDTLSGAAIANEPVTFTIGTSPTPACTANTNDNGVASCPFLVTLPAGTYTIVAAFAGDNGFLRSTTLGSLTVVTRPTALTLNGPDTGAYGDTVTFSATLTDTSGSSAVPVAGEALTFTLGAQTCTSTPTDANGTATCTFTITVVPGETTATVSFASDGFYTASTASKDFEIERRPTTLTLTAPPVALQGSSVTVTGLLTASSTHLPLSGKPLVVIFDGQYCQQTTDATGTVACKFTASHLGPTVSFGIFLGDALNTLSTGFARTIVYAPAPGNGEFVVGDGSASGSVTFWGSQWADANSLSGGDAPNGFKGWASSAPLACGGTWSAGSGDSQKPPAGPLPSYMGVVVSSAVTRSGSAIGGNAVGVVVVKTDPGYANDSGHSGTGTVVATVCSSTAAPPPGPVATSLGYSGDTQAAAGSTATLAANLVDANSQPVAGEPVTLRLGDTACEPVRTDATGRASCTVRITQDPGTYPLSATFAGDGSYQASSASATMTVTAAPPPPIACGKDETTCESLLVGPARNGRALTIVATDEQPFTRATGPTAVLSTGASLPVIATPTSGWAAQYVTHNGGSRSTKHQELLTITLPDGLPAGSYSVLITVYDAEGDVDQWSWPIVIG